MGRNEAAGLPREPIRPPRSHLERQRTGAEASKGHGLTPPAERRARKRYLKSFEHPIPDLFDTKDGKKK